MKEIKRKVLVIILALVVAMLAAQIIGVMPVQATPKEKLDFELYIEGVAMGYGPWGTYHAGPRGTEDDNPEPKDLIQRTFHAKQVNFVLFYAELTMGDETLICSPLDEQFDFVFDEKHSFNFCWNTVTGTSKAKDTLTFYEDDGTTIRGTLEITVRDKIMYVPDEEGNPTLVSEGNIFGKGTGALKGAKIEGTTSGEDVGMWPAVDENGDPINDDQGNQIVLPIRGLTRSGKISGWVTIP